MSWKILAGMGLSGVDKYELISPGFAFFGHLLQRWRRQRAIGSSQGPKLDDQIAILPIVLQLHQLSVFQRGGRKVGR